MHKRHLAVKILKSEKFDKNNIFPTYMIPVMFKSSLIYDLVPKKLHLTWFRSKKLALNGPKLAKSEKKLTKIEFSYLDDSCHV